MIYGGGARRTPVTKLPVVFAAEPAVQEASTEPAAAPGAAKPAVQETSTEPAAAAPGAAELQPTGAAAGDEGAAVEASARSAGPDDAPSSSAEVPQFDVLGALPDADVLYLLPSCTGAHAAARRLSHGPRCMAHQKCLRRAAAIMECWAPCSSALSLMDPFLLR